MSSREVSGWVVATLFAGITDANHCLVNRAPSRKNSCRDGKIREVFRVHWNVTRALLGDSQFRHSVRQHPAETQPAKVLKFSGKHFCIKHNFQVAPRFR
uniref:Putative secreted protein n=1 Tax=Anopheles triannulatus TaxID=58253 RepID=A0A2M4B5N5_9DIPT